MFVISTCAVEWVFNNATNCACCSCTRTDKSWSVESTDTKATATNTSTMAVASVQTHADRKSMVMVLGDVMGAAYIVGGSSKHVSVFFAKDKNQKTEL